MGQSAAWFPLHRLRETWHTIAGPEPMSGPVEVDEVYLGGREKNKRADKKGKRKKTAVVGIKYGETGTVRAIPVPETAAARLAEFVESNKGCPGVHRPERALRQPGQPRDGQLRRQSTFGGRPTSTACCRAAAEWSRSGPWWGRGYNGTFHRIEPKHPRRRMNGFAGRPGMTTFDAAARTRTMAQNLVGKRPAYGQIVDPGAPSGRP